MQFGTLVIGGGPAGVGTLVCAAQRGALDALLDTGIAVVEAGTTIGSGGLSQWAINSNSDGGAFCECVETGEDNILSTLATSKEYLRLVANRREPKPLGHIAALNDKVGEIMALRLQAHPKCALLTNTSVTSVTAIEGGGWKVALAPKEPGHTACKDHITAARVVLAIGASQPLPVGVSIRAGISLDTFADKLVTAAQIMSHGGAEDLIQRCRDGRIVIVGSSHSAFSVVWRVVHAAKAAGVTLAPRSIVMLQRHDPKLHFPSRQAALEAGYAFEEADVCPLSGRVNRLGGLRGDALALARQYHSGTAPPALHCVSLGESTSDATLEGLLAEAAAVVPAFGFVPNTVPVFAAGGEALSYDTDASKMLVVSTNGHVSLGGSFHDTFFAYGIGAGLPVSSETGGEPAFRGRADGVWLYQNDVGRCILKQLVPDPKVVRRVGFDPVDPDEAESTTPPETKVEAESTPGSGAGGGEAQRNELWLSIYSRIASKSSDDTPLHVLGGYNMFTEEQWCDTVWKLVGDLGITGNSHVFEAGVGAGAFVHAISLKAPGVLLSGMDYCDDLVQVAKRRLEGHFAQCDITKISSSEFGNSSYDFVLSFGVMVYLNSHADVKLATKELIARCKHGGKIFIGEVSDSAKRELAAKLRKETHQHVKDATPAKPTADHLYVPKAVFIEAAVEIGIPADQVSFVDHDTLDLSYPTAPYRYSVYITKPRRPAGQSPVRVYASMIGDLFHAGHVRFLRQVRQFGDEVVVGLTNDDDAVGYKRRPILTMGERVASISACRFVDEVIPSVPLITTRAFLDAHHIDVVAHGDDMNSDSTKTYYAAALERGQYRSVPYTDGISTTDLIKRCHDRYEAEHTA